MAADASAYGVGAVLLHKFPDGSEKAVMHASRTLTTAEKRYGQIEKEALALVFAVRRFHKLLYGRRFTLLTDHKPLLSIFGSKNGIPAHSANRLQRWALTLLGYDFEIQYRRTENFGQADALSRLISKYPTEEEDAVIAALSAEDHAESCLVDAIRALPVTAAEIKRATMADPILLQVIQFVQSGWPIGPVPKVLQPLFNRRESLCIVNGCLMFGERVVVPEALRLRALRQFHSGHPGSSRMKSVARSFAYWPGMDADIVNFVKRCTNCQQAAKNPPRQTPTPWPQPEKPWSRLHLDFAGPINGITYLVLVDAYSKWPEVVPVVPPTTSKTLEVLGQIFSQHGLPELIVSDNGSQFTSREFQLFCHQYNICHMRSPPYHPQSNGQAERFVDTFKRALLKAKGEGASAQILQRFLLVYRTTPNDATPNQQSPAEALMGRKLRTIHDAMIPKPPANVSVPPVNHGSSFKMGSMVYARDYRPRFNRWIPGKIVRRNGKLLYDVLVGTEIWVRHRDQLRHRETNPRKQPQETLPLDLLLDTFRLSSTNTECEGQPSGTEHRTLDTSLLPRRWTDRRRRQTIHLQVDPRKVRY